jgi:hypothetical protein
MDKPPVGENAVFPLTGEPVLEFLLTKPLVRFYIFPRYVSVISVTVFRKAVFIKDECFAHS